MLPRPRTRNTRWPCSSQRPAMSAAVASKIRKPGSPSMATRTESPGFADSRVAMSKASNCGWEIPGLQARRAHATLARWVQA